MDELSAWRSHPNWRLVIWLAGAILPGSTGPDPEELAGLSADSGLWRKVATDGRGDLDVWREIKPMVEQHLRGLVVVVTHASYRPDAGPFFVQAHSIDGFMRDYAEVLDDAMFSGGDVTILIPEVGVVVVVHHEEWLAVIEGQSVTGF